MKRSLPLPLSQNSSLAQPSDMPRSLIVLFAIASGLSVANVCYAQPLLDALAVDFGISQATVGGVVTATQVGCALALLLLVPLGDRVERRRLMIMQLAALVTALLIVSMASSTPVLLVGMLAIGLLGTAMTQGLIAYAASTASSHERGRVVGATQGGVFIGLLLARVFAGGVSDVAGWRGVYCGADGSDGATVMATVTVFASLTAMHELSTTDCVDVDVTATEDGAESPWYVGIADVCRLQHFLECASVALERAALWVLAHSDWCFWAGGRGWLPRAPDDGRIGDMLNIPVRLRCWHYCWHGGLCR